MRTLRQRFSKSEAALPIICAARYVPANLLLGAVVALTTGIPTHVMNVQYLDDRRLKKTLPQRCVIQERANVSSQINGPNLPAKLKLTGSGALIACRRQMDGLNSSACPLGAIQRP
jgi:hypothetical protein